MLSCCKLLKHKILIGLLYGCGLRCLEVRNLRLCDLDFWPKTTESGLGKRQKRPLLTTFRTFDSEFKKIHRSGKTGRFSIWRTSSKSCGWRIWFKIFATRRTMGGETGLKISKNIERSECSYASAQFCDASFGGWDEYCEHQKSPRPRKHRNDPRLPSNRPTFYPKTLLSAGYFVWGMQSEVVGF